MSLALTPGANTAVPPAEVVGVRLDSVGGHADLVVLLLDAAGRADGDNGVVLFSHPVSGGGSVALDVETDSVRVALGSLPPAVERVLVVAQADGSPDVTGCGALTATVTADSAVLATATFDALPAVATLQLVELYRRGGAWKVRALGDGYAEGLERLLIVHGVEVTEAAEPAATAPSSAPPPGAPDLRKAEGKLSLKKGEGPVLMTKTGLITARVSWRSGTDYDVYALVLMRGGQQVDVATFDATGIPARPEFKGIRHLGDVVAGSTEEQEEIIEIRLTPEVLAVVPVAYSAISNGGGSFRRYHVSLEIDNGAGTTITIPAENASTDDAVYTCVPGLIRNGEDGVIVEPLEQYSERGSERRPVVELIDGDISVVMDAGPANLRKKKRKKTS